MQPCTYALQSITIAVHNMSKYPYTNTHTRMHARTQTHTPPPPSSCSLHLSGRGHRGQMLTLMMCSCLDFPCRVLMLDEALLHVQLPTVNTSIPALSSSAVYLSDEVHQTCFVTPNEMTTMLTAPTATHAVSAPGWQPSSSASAHPSCSVLRFPSPFSHRQLLPWSNHSKCCRLKLVHTSWGTSHTLSAHELSHHSTASCDHKLNVCFRQACT